MTRNVSRLLKAALINIFPLTMDVTGYDEPTDNYHWTSGLGKQQDQFPKTFKRPY